MDRDEIDICSDLSQCIGDRIRSLISARDYIDAQDCDVRCELTIEALTVLGRDDNDQLLDIVAVQKLFGRVKPDGTIVQRHEGLAVVGVVETAAFSRGGHDDGKTCHERFPFMAV